MKLAPHRTRLRSLLLPIISGILVLLLVTSLGALAQGQGQDKSAAPTSESLDISKEKGTPKIPDLQDIPTIGSDYAIGPEDVLRVDVFDVPELSNLTLRVANDGTISPPLLGHVQAAGLTPSQLRRELESKWGKDYLQSPQVSVFVQEFHAQPVSVIGAVERPGLYPLTGPRTLIEMLSQAGGLAKRSSAPAGRFLYVTRRRGFQDLQPAEGMRLMAHDKVEIDLRKLLYSKEDTLNIAIEPRDIISVGKADVVYVAGGGVAKPGGLLLEDQTNVTVFQALAMAQGLSANAARHDARIIRQKPDGSRLEIPIDIDNIEKGKAPDPVLAANDILFVPDSKQKATLKRAVDMTVATVSGLLIFGKL